MARAREAFDLRAADSISGPVPPDSAAKDLLAQRLTSGSASFRARWNSLSTNSALSGIGIVARAAAAPALAFGSVLVISSKNKVWQRCPSTARPQYETSAPFWYPPLN